MVINWMMFVNRSCFELFECLITHGCLVMGDFTLT
jgi:hypothetical protein